MVYDLYELAANVKINGRFYAARTLRKRAEENSLPSYIKVYKFKCGWIFEIQEIPDHLKPFQILLKPKPMKEIQPLQSQSDQP